MHGLLKAIGIETIPPGQTEESLVKKILTDNFFWNRVIARLIELEAVATADNLPKLERDALRDRIVPRVVKPAVVWSLIMPDQTTSGLMVITATCGPETRRWNGDYKKIRTIRMFGELVPGDICEVYSIHYGTPQADPGLVADQRQQERYKLEAAQKAQAQRLSPEEILVNEQLSHSGLR